MWQPIETAPRDGTEVIVWSKEQPSPYLAAWHEMHGWMVPDTCPHAWTELLIAPTHWTTMPPPPAESTTIAWMKEDATKEEMIDFLAGRRIEK